MKLLYNFIILIYILICINLPVYGSRISDSYDGNIFPIYAGNGSLVPPQTSLKESIQNKRVSILFFYLDDSADSKAIAPVIAGLDLIWKNNIDIIPLTTDELQNKIYTDPLEEGFYWNGYIPQTIILDETGSVKSLFCNSSVVRGIISILFFQIRSSPAIIGAKALLSALSSK